MDFLSSLIAKYKQKSVLYIIFPLPKESENKWNLHNKKICTELDTVFSKEFYFINEVRGMIYFGLIDDTTKISMG